VTYNVFHGGASSGLTGDAFNLETRLDLAARELEALQPDIVGLQEVSVGHGRGNVAERLARRLGLHWVHGPATSRVFPISLANRFVVWLLDFNEGPAVLSRFPITGSEVFDLPRCAKFFDPRVALRAELRTPWGPLQMFSTHVSRDDCQVRRVAEIVRERRGPLPSILTGDFNAVESLPVMADLREGGFIDAFRAANPTEPGLTVWQRINAAAPTVFRRVDYIFVVPGRNVTGRVVSSRVVLDEPGRARDGTPLWPSDHYGVLAEIGL
jgi:endonuclease/exonuclease/phosphatase family metal-dependent hydrolase